MRKSVCLAWLPDLTAATLAGEAGNFRGEIPARFEARMTAETNISD